jgi:FAD/FMN-containing dehydrogenase
MAATTLPRRLPAGILFDTSARAIETFAASLGGAHGARPLALASPTTQAQVEQLVRWACAHEVPLVPVSSPNGPRTRGDTRPSVPAVVADLSQMRRVIHVDGRDRIAVIEPGVTFDAFDEALRPHGLRAFRPLLPRQAKSVLGAYLEREPCTVPNEHWDTTDPLAALSVTFGNGEHFRTGGAALPGTLEENLQRGNRLMMAAGPLVTDYTRVLLGAQGTLGIVSWASIYCEQIPAREAPRLFGSNDYRAVAELARLLLLHQLGTQCFLLDRTQLAVMLHGDEAGFEPFRQGGGRVNPCPQWLLYVNLTATDYLPDQRMAWQLRDLEALAEQAGAQGVTEQHGASAQALAQRLGRSPATPYQNMPRGQHREVFCLTQMNKVPALLERIAPTLASAAVHGQLLHGVYIQPTVQGASCHLCITLFHAAAQRTATAEAEAALATCLAEAGGFFSRPYGAWAELAYARDSAIVPHLRKAKQLFDPKGILNPGRLCF